MPDRPTYPDHTTMSPCDAVHQDLLAGRVEAPRVAEHVSHCEACAELARDDGALAHWLGTDIAPPDDLDAMLGATTRGLDAETGVPAAIRGRSTLTRVSALVLWAIGLAVAVLVWTPRPDLAVYPSGRLVAVAGLLLLTTAVGVGVLMRPTWRPALPAWVDRATLIGVVSLPLVVAGLPRAHALHPASTLVDRFVEGTVACFVFGTVVALAVGAVWRSVEQRSHPSAMRWVTAIATAAVVGNLALLLHCPVTQLDHLLLGHGAIGGVLAVLLLAVHSTRPPR